MTMQNTKDVNDSGRWVLAALCAAIWMIVGIEALSAQEPVQGKSGGNDVEMTVDIKQLGAQVAQVMHDVGAVLGDSKVASLTDELRKMKSEDSRPSAKEISDVLGAVLHEYDNLGPGLKNAISKLDGAVDSLVTARGQFESRMARRQVGGSGSGMRDKALERYRDHLRELAVRLKRTSSASERQSLERVFDSSYQLYKTVERVRGRVSKTERIADERILQYIARFQTIFTVASTRLKTASVGVASDRELVEILIRTLSEVSDAKDVLDGIPGLKAGDSPFLSGLDKLATRNFIDVVERRINQIGDELDKQSAIALTNSESPGETSIFDAQSRERAFIEVGAGASEPAKNQGGK